jgi:hypothetical protein
MCYTGSRVKNKLRRTIEGSTLPKRHPYRIVWTPFVFKNLAIDPWGRVERMETIQKSPTKTQKGTARAVPFADLGRTRILWDRVGLKSKQEIEENPEAQLDSRN